MPFLSARLDLPMFLFLQGDATVDLSAERESQVLRRYRDFTLSCCHSNTVSEHGRKRGDVSEFGWVGDIVKLMRYSYSNTVERSGSVDDLRLLGIHYAAYMVDQFSNPF